MQALGSTSIPPNASEAMALGRALLTLGRLSEATGWAHYALDLGRALPGACDRSLLLGECLAAKGDLEEAYGRFIEAARAPAEPGADRGGPLRALGHAAHCLAERGTAREAVALFEEAIAALKQTPLPDRTALRMRFHTRAALCLAELGEAQAALEHYRRAADRADACLHGELAPDDALDSLLGAAELALRFGEMERAEASFQHLARLATRLPPRTLGALRAARMETGLGLCAVDRNRWPDAVRHFRAALRRRRPRTGTAPEGQGATMLHLAEACARAGRPRAAHKAFADALALHEGVAEPSPAQLAERALAHQLYGGFLLECGDAEAAERQYRSAVTAWREIPAVERIDARLLSLSEHQLGACLAVRGDNRRAAVHFLAAVSAAREGDAFGKVDGHSLAVSLAQLGTTLLGENEPDAAETAFREATGLWLGPGERGLPNHEAAGGALHGQAACRLLADDLDAAATLLGQAAVEKQHGRPDGSTDAASLGGTLLLLAQTQLAREQGPLALETFERAAEQLTLGRAAGAPVSALLSLALHAIGGRRSAAGDLHGGAAAFAAAAAAKGYDGPGDAVPDFDHLSVTLHELAGCHLTLGEVAEARRWYLEAALVAARGDEHGQVDHDSVGTSLHQVGHCYTLENETAAARTYFERAVEQKQLGDSEARVSASSLGTSYQAVGYCLLDEGRRGEALLWFRRALNEKRRGDTAGRVDEAAVGSAHHQIAFTLAADGHLEDAVEEFGRAAEAKAKGDIWGRVDHESLGATWHLLGDCCLELSRPEEALGWYERAAEAAARGDVHGRVDSESLGLSMHQAGFAAFASDRTEDAVRWFEQAAAAKARGNLSGAIDRDSLSTTWHELGFCAVREDDYEAALSWFLKAADAKSAGNLKGRVDQAGLARCLQRAAECELQLERGWDARMTLERALKVARVAAEEDPDAVSTLLEEIERTRRRARRLLTNPA